MAKVRLNNVWVVFVYAENRFGWADPEAAAEWGTGCICPG